MSTPILATKLYIPPPRANLVFRPRLIEQLDAGLGHNQAFDRKLTLVSAPAGFGKTTLVSSWIHNLQLTNDDLRLDAAKQSQIEHRIPKIANYAAWLSMDVEDNDPSRFITYLIAALQTIAPNLGDGISDHLQSPQQLPVDALLTTLLNELTTISNKIILALDDYHLVDSEPVDSALAFLLDHLPPQMHIVMTTREDPNIPLARLRARGQLTEVRAADLRFTPTEAADFLNQTMGLTLSMADINALDVRTEGWIVGLQLAALALQGANAANGQASSASIIKDFTGSHRFVLDFLVEEVLQQQPKRVRNFLLQTAILDRLNGPLCDALTKQKGSQQMLDDLERDNLFLIPLDNQRQWYRYHHLFAEVLQAHTVVEQLDHIPTLHQRASVWFEQNDQPVEAIHHALCAEDFERAADLIELAYPAMGLSYQGTTWLSWVKALPDDLVRNRPVLNFGYAWGLVGDGAFEEGEARLQEVERLLNATANTPEPDLVGLVVVDEAQFQALPVSIATVRAYLAQTLGDISGTVKYAQRALDLLPEEDYIERGTAAAMLGFAYWANGDLKTAYQASSESMASFKKAGNILVVISGTFVLADVKVAQGHLQEAVRIYEESMQLALKQQEPMLLGMVDLHVGLSELYREQGDLKAAQQHLLKSQELDEQTAHLVYLPRRSTRYRACFAQARLYETQGDLEGALNLLDKAESVYYKSPIPDIRPVAAFRARVWVAQGQLTQALNWVHKQGLSVDDDLSYRHEFEHITLARIHIAQYRRDKVDGTIRKAFSLLERLLQAAEAGERMGSVIEILILQALAHGAQNNIPRALIPLEHALRLAEPEGYVRIFVDEGLPMANLLAQMVPPVGLSDYVNTLRNAFDGLQPGLADITSIRDATATSPLIEPLSDRELDVLQLIAQGLSNREISERLFLALSTVKGHNRNIYSKLQVQRRTEAVARAREIGLL